MPILAILLGISGLSTISYLLVPGFKTWVNKVIARSGSSDHESGHKTGRADGLEAQLKKTEGEKRAAGKRAEEAEKVATSLQAKIEEIKDQVRELTQSNAQATEKAQTAQAALAAAEERATASESKVQDQTRTLEDLQGQLQQASVRTTSLTNDLTAARKDNVTLTTRIKEAMDTVAEQKVALDANNRKTGELSNKLEALDTKAETAAEENARLTTEMATLATRQNGTAKQLQTAQAATVAAEQANAKAQGELKALGASSGTERAEAQRKAHDSATKLASAQAEVTRMTASQQATGSEIEGLKQKLAAAGTTREQDQKARSELQQQVGGLRAAMGTLQGNVMAAETERDAAIKQAKTQQAANAAREEQLASQLAALGATAGSEAAALRQQLSASQQRSGELASRLDKLTSDLTKSATEKSDLQHRVEALTERQGTTAEQLKKAEAANTTAEAANSKAQAELKKSKEDKQATEEQCREAQAKADEAAGKLAGAEAEIKQMGARQKTTAEDLEQLKNDLKAKEAESQQYRQQIPELEGQVGELRAAASGLQASLAALQAQKTQGEQAAGDTKRELEKQLKQLQSARQGEQETAQALESSLRAQLDETRRGMEGLNGQVKTAQDAKTQAESELEKARAETADRGRERDAEKQKADALGKEIARLQKALAQQSHKVGWDLTSSGYGSHTQLDDTPAVVLHPPQNYYMDGDAKKYENKVRPGMVTLTLPPEMQWKGIEIVDTGKRVAIAGWRNSDGTERSPGNEKTVPWYAIKAKDTGKIMAEFPPTVGITIVGHGLDTNQPLQEGTPKKDGPPRDRIMQAPLPLQYPKDTISDNDNDIDLVAMGQDEAMKNYMPHGLELSDPTLATTLPLAMLKARLAELQDVEEKYKTVSSPETGTLPPRAETAAGNPSPDAHELMRNVRNEVIKLSQNPLAWLSETLPHVPKDKSKTSTPEH